MQRLSITPRSSEISGGHVSNTVPPVWFQDARLDICQAVSELNGENALFGVVRSAKYDYERELYFGSAVEIRTAIRKIGNSSVVFFQEAWQNQHRAVTAETVILLIDTVTGGPSTLSDPSRIFLKNLE